MDCFDESLRKAVKSRLNGDVTRHDSLSLSRGDIDLTTVKRAFKFIVVSDTCVKTFIQFNKGHN